MINYNQRETLFFVFNKDEFVKYSLHSIINSFWSWTLQDQNLMHATFSTLCTYTANNKPAAVSLTQSPSLLAASAAVAPMTPTSMSSSISSQSSNAITILNSSNDQQRGTSLLQSIIKIILKNNNKHLLQKYGFGILVNCAQVNECKTIISKVSF